MSYKQLISHKKEHEDRPYHLLMRQDEDNYVDGMQFYSEEKAKTFKNSLPKKWKANFIVEKDKKPDWLYGSEWKQTYTLRQVK